MFWKYSIESVLMDFLPMQTNVSSTSLPENTLDICYLPKASPWPHTKSRSSKIGLDHRKSRISKSWFHLHISPTREPLGISPMSAILPLRHLKRLSPQLWSLPIGSQTLKLQSRLTLLTTHSLLSFQ